MRITCPSCTAAYEVPDSLVTPGRITRCARCGSEWTPVTAVAVRQPDPQQIEALPEPPEPLPQWSATGHSAMDRLAANPTRQPSQHWLRLAWTASLAVLLLALWAAYVWRNPIVSAWPPSERAYALFGLHTEKQ